MSYSWKLKYNSHKNYAMGGDDDDNYVMMMIML